LQIKRTAAIIKGEIPKVVSQLAEIFLAVVYNWIIVLHLNYLKYWDG